MITLENEYYLRIILLLCDACSYITKKIIQKELPKYGGDLDALLKRYEGNLRHEFHKKQMQKLFPNDGYDKTNIETWDIQMLVGVLLLIFRHGLRDTDNKKIKEIKEFRNTILAHNHTATLDKEKYKDIQRQLQNAIKSLASGCDRSVIIRCDEYISTFESESLDINSAIKCVQQLSDSDENFEKILDIIRSTQETSKDVQEKLNLLSERVEKIGEQTEGISEILNELKVLKLEVEKLRGSSCVQTEPSKADKSMEKVEADIEQKIHACNQKVDPDVRRSVRPSDYEEKLVQEEDTSLEQYDTRTTISSTASDKFVEDHMPSGEKPSVRHIRVIPPFLTSDMTVAAIDIGTSFSGLAYSCTDRICTLTWNRYPPNYKTPSVVLFDEEERFDSFGYDAENKYAYLVDDDEHLDWHLFQNFKMKLYTGREILDDGNGRTMDAVEVMSAVLSYFNKEVLDHFRRLNYHVRADDIHWVLTICTDSHAHFIRNAAMQAGIHQEHLQILHEVEAASVYCQHGAVDDVNRRMPPGTKYITIEMGGGTVVIAVCKVPIEENNVLYTESYTDCGGTMVDARFFEFMASLTGEEVFSKFCRDNKEDHLELRRNFEQAKRGLDNLSTGELKIRIPRGLLDTLKNETGKDFKEILKESNYRDNVTLKMRSLFIDIQIIRDLFTCCCQNIVRHITDVLATRDAKGIKLLFLTGGFSESQIMQNAIASAFSTTLVLVPEQADLAVLKGAVMFGNHPHQPDTIRVFKNTYGIEITPVFDPTLHSESHRVSINGQYRCKNVFRKFVGIGETSLITDVFCHEHATLFPFQTSIVLKIFASSAKNPLYVDEPGVTKIGELTVELPWREKSVINIKFNFGRTQLQVTAVDLTNGESKRLSLKFLG